MQRPSIQAARTSARGVALATVVVLVAVLSVFLAIGLTVTSRSVNEVEFERRTEQAFYAAEAGVSAALARVALAYQTGAEVACDIGSQAAPNSMQAGTYWSRVVTNADDTLTVLAIGSSAGSERTIEAILQPILAGPMEHAMYAGNMSKDPAYQLDLGGTGAQADVVNGDVYSGGDVVITGNAVVNGDLTSSGSIVGGTGSENVAIDVPHLLEIDYEAYNDYDVAQRFETAPRSSDDAGGTAGQLPASDPAHIFRKNPSDRSSDTTATAKDDYFLEDPYEAVSADYPQDGSAAFLVSLPAEANNKVFFIDGNLWLHNRKTYSLKIKNSGPNPTRVTFVVKGNIYFSDNFFYQNAAQDGVAFLALSDPEHEDSGNVYFGDPSFGTMQYAEAMIFAENNFHDNNLDASGSAKVTLRGCMTAANQLAIQRDYGTQHTKLSLTFDPRQAAGILNLPGIPMAADHPVGFTVVSWRELSTPRSLDLRDIPVSNAAPSAVDDDTFTVESPADEPYVPNPFEGTANDWRNNWEQMYGKSWKSKKKKGKWNSTSGPGSYP